MDQIVIIAAASAAFCSGLFVGVIGAASLLGTQLRTARAARNAMSDEAGRATYRLRALRRACFLTNEKGHRVRYAKASHAVRERAEGGR